MRDIMKRLAVLLFCFIFLVLPVWAFNLSVNIYKIKDVSEAKLIAGEEVTIKIRTPGSPSLMVLTNSGTATVADLANGKYNITAQWGGKISTKIVDASLVSADSEIKVDLIFKVPKATPPAISTPSINDKFLDKALLALVIKSLGLAVDANLTQENAEKLSLLSADNKGIIYLNGLEYCKNLTSANLENNKISSLAPLAGLTKLTSLNFNNNGVFDIAPISGLTNLKSLLGNNNKLTNLSALANLNNLNELNLSNNKIINVTPLTGIIKLTYLDLGNNHIIDIAPLASLLNLNFLSLEHNYIVDISALANLNQLGKLSMLWLSDNQIKDLSPLAGLALPFDSLTDLDLNNNLLIKDISALSKLTTLSSLKIAGTLVASLEGLAGLSMLNKVDISKNKYLSDIKSLTKNANFSTGDIITTIDNLPSINADLDLLKAKGVKIVQ